MTPIMSAREHAGGSARSARPMSRKGQDPSDPGFARNGGALVLLGTPRFAQSSSRDRLGSHAPVFLEGRDARAPGQRDAAGRRETIGIGSE